jgi:stalled ribosome rescue protein Dom34
MAPKNTDSIISAQERAAKIREESAQIEREQAEQAEKQRVQQAAQKAVAVQQEARNIELVSSGTTREHLLDYIRRKREEKPVEIAPLGRTPGQMQEFNAEIEAGRAAVAKAEREQNMYREKFQNEAAIEQARTGHMEQVYNPNPDQQQVFPALKATLPGSK